MRTKDEIFSELNQILEGYPEYTRDVIMDSAMSQFWAEACSMPDIEEDEMNPILRQIAPEGIGVKPVRWERLLELVKQSTAAN